MYNVYNTNGHHPRRTINETKWADKHKAQTSHWHMRISYEMRSIPSTKSSGDENHSSAVFSLSIFKMNETEGNWINTKDVNILCSTQQQHDNNTQDSQPPPSASKKIKERWVLRLFDFPQTAAMDKDKTNVKGKVGWCAVCYHLERIPSTRPPTSSSGLQLQ